MLQNTCEETMKPYSLLFVLCVFILSVSDADPMPGAFKILQLIGREGASSNGGDDGSSSDGGGDGPDCTSDDGFTQKTLKSYKKISDGYTFEQCYDGCKEIGASMSVLENDSDDSLAEELLTLHGDREASLWIGRVIKEDETDMWVTNEAYEDSNNDECYWLYGESYTSYGGCTDTNPCYCVCSLS